MDGSSATIIGMSTIHDTALSGCNGTGHRTPRVSRRGAGTTTGPELEAVVTDTPRGWRLAPDCTCTILTVGTRWERRVPDPWCPVHATIGRARGLRAVPESPRPDPRQPAGVVNDTHPHPPAPSAAASPTSPASSTPRSAMIGPDWNPTAIFLARDRLGRLLRSRAPADRGRQTDTACAFPASSRHTRQCRPEHRPRPATPMADRTATSTGPESTRPSVSPAVGDRLPVRQRGPLPRRGGGARGRGRRHHADRSQAAHRRSLGAWCSQVSRWGWSPTRSCNVVVSSSDGHYCQ